MNRLLDILNRWRGVIVVPACPEIEDEEEFLMAGGFFEWLLDPSINDHPSFL